MSLTMRNKKVMTEKFVPTAKVVDGILILSLPDALSPVVWQMEVGQSKSSALEVRANDDGSVFTLVLKTPRQDVLEIAQYNLRDDAVRALLTVSSAMEQAQGQIRMGASGNGASRQHGSPYDYSVPALRAPSNNNGRLKNYVFKPMAYISSALVIFFVLFIVASSLIGLFAKSDGTGTATASNSSSQTGSMSAEDFLEGR